jgi:hypothetical protein
MLSAVRDHILLMVAIAVAYWWATPYLVRKTLANGGGDIIKGHIRAANAEQSIETAKVVAAAITNHEGREWQQYGALGEGQTLVREKVADLAARLDVHLARAG